MEKWLIPGWGRESIRWARSTSFCAKSKDMLKEWWGHNKPIWGDVTGKTGGNLSIKTIKLAYSNPWIKWGIMSSHWKLDEEQDNYIALKYILTKHLQTMKEKKVASQWKSPSDSTLIKPSKRISSVVGKIKTAIVDKMHGRNAAWLHHLHEWWNIGHIHNEEIQTRSPCFWLPCCILLEREMSQTQVHKPRLVVKPFTVWDIKHQAVRLNFH